MKSLSEMLKKKKEAERRQKMWRGGVAHAELKGKDHVYADAMPKDREEELKDIDAMDDSELDEYLKKQFAHGGEVDEDQEEGEGVLYEEEVPHNDLLPTREEELAQQNKLSEEKPDFFKALKKEKYAKGGMISYPKMESQQEKLKRFTTMMKSKRR